MVFIYLIICNGVVLFSISTGAEGFHRLFWFWGKVVRTRALLTAVRFLPFDSTSTAPLLHLWNRPFYTTRYFGQWRVGGFFFKCVSADGPVFNLLPILFTLAEEEQRSC